MTIHTVDDTLLFSPDVEAYFNRADGRIKIGLRYALQMLNLPMPEYAKRQPAGAKRRVMDAVIKGYEADHGRIPKVQAPRKPNASPAAICAAIEKRSGGNLFNETFG